MVHRILMPTDGSPVSEAPVPLVAALARAQNAEVVVARIVQPKVLSSAEDGPWAGDLYEQVRQAQEEDARVQVDELVTRLRLEGVSARGEVQFGPVAAGLLDLESRLGVDLVVMATHGRTGLQRFALGSVADRMVREGTTPVLMVRPSARPLQAPEMVLVPLDGSPLAEQVLPLVKELAGRPLRRIRLLRVLLPEDHPEEVHEYLKHARREFSGLGIPVEVTVEMGDPAEMIGRVAATTDLVIIGTHGRSGFDRFRHGSVADQLVRESKTPVLLVRAIPATTEHRGRPGLSSVVASLVGGF